MKVYDKRMGGTRVLLGRATAKANGRVRRAVSYGGATAAGKEPVHSVHGRGVFRAYMLLLYCKVTFA